MKFDKTYIEKLELFEATKKKKKKSKSTKRDETLSKVEGVETDKLIFSTEERAILNLGDTIAVVTKNMGDLEQEIKDAVKDNDKAKADQLERQIDDYKEKLEKLVAAEKKAITALKDKIDELLKCTDDKDYIDVLKSVKKKYK